jgi:hypothetical protein
MSLILSVLCTYAKNTTLSSSRENFLIKKSGSPVPPNKPKCKRSPSRSLSSVPLQKSSKKKAEKSPTAIEAPKKKQLTTKKSKTVAVDTNDEEGSI